MCIRDSLLNGDIDVVAMGSIPLSDWETIKNSDQVVAASVEDYSYQYMLSLIHI